MKNIDSKYFTTKRQFNLFKREVILWLDRFGLWDYRIEFRHGNHPELPNARAWFVASTEDLVACLGLTKDWSEDKPTSENIRIAAMHEVFHILFGLMSCLAGERYVSKGLYEEEEHRVIRRFENYFYGKARKKNS